MNFCLINLQALETHSSLDEPPNSPFFYKKNTGRRWTKYNTMLDFASAMANDLQSRAASNIATATATATTTSNVRKFFISFLQRQFFFLVPKDLYLLCTEWIAYKNRNSTSRRKR